MARPARRVLRPPTGRAPPPPVQLMASHSARMDAMYSRMPSWPWYTRPSSIPTSGRNSKSGAITSASATKSPRPRPPKPRLTMSASPSVMAR